MALLYALAGVNHFVHPETYLAIMPPWLPAHSFLVALSGVAEILLAVLLVVPYSRRVAAWLIIGLLILVFPANVHMLLNYAASKDPKLWIAILRLPLQIVLIWWAFQFTKQSKRDLQKID